MSTKKKKTVKDLSLELDQVKQEIIFLREYIDSIKADFTLQINDVEKSKTKEDIIRVKTTKQYKCFKCDMKFQNKTRLINHIRENHEKLQKCTKCDSTFVKMNELESHMENIHPEEKKNQM